MVINWKNASAHELRLLDAISILVAGRNELIEFLLDPLEPRLRKRAGILREDSWQFSHGEILAVHACLDLWSGSGHLEFWDCLETWDQESWIRFFAAIAVARNIDLKQVALCR